MSEEEVKEVLNRNRYTAQLINYSPLRARCYCANPEDVQYRRQTWCPPKHFLESFCDDYKGRGPDFDRDGVPDEPNYEQELNRTVVKCNGLYYFECGRWTWTSRCCLTSQAKPGCLEGLDDLPGRVIECGSIRGPGNRPIDSGLPTDVPPEDVRPTGPASAASLTLVKRCPVPFTGHP